MAIREKREVTISIGADKGGIKGVANMKKNLNKAILNLQQAKKLANKAVRLSQVRLAEKAEDKIANSLKFIGKSFFWNQFTEKAIKEFIEKNKKQK